MLNMEVNRPEPSSLQLVIPVEVTGLECAFSSKMG
jgi:hypothetical protein